MKNFMSFGGRRDTSLRAFAGSIGVGMQKVEDGDCVQHGTHHVIHISDFFSNFLAATQQSSSTFGKHCPWTTVHHNWLPRESQVSVNPQFSSRQRNLRYFLIVGAQWGDEGKGKLVDVICEDVDIVARCQVRELTISQTYSPNWRFRAEIMQAIQSLLVISSTISISSHLVTI